MRRQHIASWFPSRTMQCKNCFLNSVDFVIFIMKMDKNENNYEILSPFKAKFIWLKKLMNCNFIFWRWIGNKNTSWDLITFKNKIWYFISRTRRDSLETPLIIFIVKMMKITSENLSPFKAKFQQQALYWKNAVLF